MIYSPDLGMVLQLLRVRRGMEQSVLGAVLEARGAVSSVESYRAMECGRELPDDGNPFVRVYAEVMNLTDDELAVVLTLWAFAVLRGELGDVLAFEVLQERIRTQAVS